MSNNILEINSLNMKYSKEETNTLNNVSFSISSGSIHGLLGPNGAGKTTIIKTILKALTPHSGDIKMINETISYIPEKTTFPSKTTVKEYLLDFVGLSNGLDRKENEIFVNEKIKELELVDFKNKNPNELSSGQKKKISLALAMLRNSKLLIVDEPLTNLDPVASDHFLNILKKINKEQKISILFCSHMLNDIEDMLDEITIIKKGEVMYTGSKEDAFKEVKSKKLLDVYKHFIK